MRATLSSQGNLRGVRILFIYSLPFQVGEKVSFRVGNFNPGRAVMSSMGIVLEKRRQSMTGELFAEIMFLSDTV